jgi:hypothetical protein
MHAQPPRPKGRQRSQQRKRLEDWLVPILTGSALVSFLCIAFVMGYIAVHRNDKNTDYADGFKAGVAQAELRHSEFVATVNRAFPCGYAEQVCKRHEKTSSSA